ncbi:MAG: 5-formyltetrahydrofolate cyclo-ligase [Gallionella sp.]|nr:5-formyltetrahydrofolate cyclo-ligase [Gallionella sp.]MDD4947854.1 5-formyltetrahydrofolate cyclo-ligase [Gallionella sp.]MDD5611555.1 5-formyltetrahydrofolate cyclo-ligase [Gallionella sp.]
MTLSSEKKSIRQGILAMRGEISADLRAGHNATITARLLNLPEYRDARTVLGYMNFGSEYASEQWVAQALTEGKRMVLPKVNHHTNLLDLYLVDDPETQLGTGLWGIREPLVERCERLTVINEVEFALLPGVGFTRDGARLGYGGGYYDKLLASMTHRPALVAAAYALQIMAWLPQEATDVKVAQIVTEAETIACYATGNP